MTNESGDAEGLGPAAVVVILVLGATLTLLVWMNLRRNLQADVDHQTQAYASSLAQAVEREIQRVDSLLRGRAQMWMGDVFTHDLDAWREDVAMLLAANPALLAVLRADPNWEIAGTDEGKQILREVLPEARRQAADADSEWIVGPLTTRGLPIFAVQVLASREGVDTRTVVAALDANRLLAALLETRAIGYAIRVRAGETDLYRRDVAEDRRAGPEFARTEPIVLRSGDDWQVEVTPAEDATTVGPWPQGPTIALILGIFASALIAASVHFGTLSWRRERMLRRSNTALRHQIDDTLRGEGELKQLSVELEARVAERTAELNETIVELETFNYSVSHDLRGPLGAVINFAAILEEDYGDRLDATGRDHLHRIVASAGSAVSMMDALLTYSRSGRAELRKSHLDMRRVACEVQSELVAASPEQECQVEIGDLPPVHADESMMRFVFANLLGNACKFAPPGDSARVEVGGSIGSDENTYWVRDEGIGFDMRFADKLFKVFERLHTTEQHAGHGVGLAIVARMIRRHGGRVWAQGAPGKGATFYFSVPSSEA